MTERIQDQLRNAVLAHRGIPEVAKALWQIDMLMMKAADKIEALEKANEDLEERIAIMSEDQYKSSEIRFP